MKRRINLKSIILGLILLNLFFSPVYSSQPTLVTLSMPQEVAKEEIPIEFPHSEEFNVKLDENQVEAEEFNGSEFLDELDTFNETEVNVYMGTDIILGISQQFDYLQVTVTESYIYDVKFILFRS